MPGSRAHVDGFNQSIDWYGGAGRNLFNHFARGRLEDAKERVFGRHQGRLDEPHVDAVQPEFLRHPGCPITGGGQLVGGKADRIAFNHEAGHTLLPWQGLFGVAILPPSRTGGNGETPTKKRSLSLSVKVSLPLPFG